MNILKNIFKTKKKISAQSLITQDSVMQADEVKELHKLIKKNQAEMDKVKKHLKPFVDEAIKNKHIEKIGLDELTMIQLLGSDLKIKKKKDETMGEAIWGAILNQLT